MTRKDAHLDALVRSLGTAYYQAIRGEGSAADVSSAVARVAEAADDRHTAEPSPVMQTHAGSRRTGRWQVRDVMTTKVVTVTRHATYKQIAQLLHQHHLTALPVVTAEGMVAGVVSEADMLRKPERYERPGRRPGWQLHPAARAKSDARTATGLMTSPAVTVVADAALGTAAMWMSQHHIKRRPVVDGDGTLIGIVSRADLLRVFLRPDADIAAEASALMTDILLADPAAVHVSVRGGVVTLAGRLGSQDQIDTAVRLTEGIDGVVAVTSALTAPLENWPGGGYRLPTGT